jgi:O-antigen/teichoic acid export membrane protein
MAIIVTSYIYLFVIGVAGAVLVGVPFLRFIKPDIKISIPIVLGMSLFQFMLKLRNCYTSYFSCTNRINYMKAFVISSILTILFAIILLDRYKLGMWGMIIAQILSQALFNSWYWQWLAHKELEFSFPEMMSMGNTDIKNMIGHMIGKIKERGNK